jgi:hypothetical protein
MPIRRSYGSMPRVIEVRARHRQSLASTAGLKWPTCQAFHSMPHTGGVVRLDAAAPVTKQKDFPDLFAVPLPSSRRPAEARDGLGTTRRCADQCRQLVFTGEAIVTLAVNELQASPIGNFGFRI